MADSTRLDMRLDPETERLLEELEQRLGLSRSAAIRYSVRRAAQFEGIPVHGSIVDGLTMRPGRKRRADRDSAAPDA